MNSLVVRTRVCLTNGYRIRHPKVTNQKPHTISHFSSIEKNPLQTIIIIRRFNILRLQVLLSDQRGPRQASKHDHKTQLIK